MRRLVLTALALWTFAGAVYFARVLTFGERPAYIHVRWAPRVNDQIRTTDEEKYGLRQPELREGRTWGYALTDLSRANVTALVNDPDVEDTHNINRLKFRPGLFTPRLPYQTSVPPVPVSLNALSALLFLTGAFAIGLAALGAVAPNALRSRRLAAEAVLLEPRATLRTTWQRLSTWLTARVPEMSAEATGLFRIVFGSSLLLFVLGRPVLAAWAAAPENVVSSFQQAALDVILRAPWIASMVRPWLMLWGALFIAGAMTRTSFAMLTLGVLPWAVLHTTQVTHHTISALMLTLLVMQGVRWGDAFSIDAWRRGTAPRASTREYGFVVWAPSFVLGVVFLAAAIAKLRESGLAWILNGTVKYHFLSDAGQAMVDWGIYIGRYPSLAIVLSFGAIAIESLVIVGVLSRHYVYRVLAGLASMSLLMGFALFQGLRWPAWWMLLLSFLPWHLVRPLPTRDGGERRPALPHLATAMAVLICVQLFISTFRLEITPLFSQYDMYSTTYGSTEEYASKAGLSYWLIADRADGTTNECQVSRSAADTISRAIADPSQWRGATPVLDGCFDASAIARVSVQGRRADVDWSRQPPAEVVTVPLAGPSPASRH